MTRLPRLPVPVAPARHETLASYLSRLAALHGLNPLELWEPISTPRPGTRRRDVDADRLAVITGRPRGHLARALPELRDPPPQWAAWRHQPQPRCPRCDAGHDGGPVLRLLPHHRYVCTRHGYWIGPPDAGQPATALGVELDDVVCAQRRHLRLLRRRGSTATYDAVLTGLLICGHLWADRLAGTDNALGEWTRRAAVLIPAGAEPTRFSASRLFAAVYPEAVSLAVLVASPAWRRHAGGDTEQRQRFLAEMHSRIGRAPHRSSETTEAIAHWMKYDSHRPPSRPDKTFPDTRDYGAVRPAAINAQTRDRQNRSAAWFARNRRGGSAILHHRHIRPVVVREWSPAMDGIVATIFASGTTIDLDHGAPRGRDLDRPGSASAGNADPTDTEIAALI